nr:S1 RNA-binding domain-containing protein [Pirellula staleyi]
MLSIGDVVTAEVISVQVFGVFCRYASREMLVVIPETSWIASFNSCLQFAAVGDELEVIVLNIDHPTGKVAASVKAIHPDPWENGTIVVGKLYETKVVRFVESADRADHQPGYLMELVPGGYAMIPAENRQLPIGQTIVVRLLAADFRHRSVIVGWA